MADVPTEIEELLPLDEDLSAEDELAAADDAIDGDDLVLDIEPEPQPIGRGIAFDWTRREVVMSGHGPSETLREATVKGWIEKCLNTHEGAHPIHPEGYGLAHPLGTYLGGPLPDLGQLERDISDALLFHPAITEVKDFSVYPHDREEGDMAADVRFTAELDDGSEMDFETTLASGEVL